MVFKKLIKDSDRVKLYFGLPEAEAESNENSRVYLPDVYEEQAHLYEDLSHEKFIVIGRKGAGKSAFARKTYLLAKEKANMFCSFIRQDIINLEELVQAGGEKDKLVNKENLFRWIVYTNLLKLIISNEAIDADTNFGLLRTFIRKNSGFIEIHRNETLELIRKNNFEINIEPFKRFMKNKFGTAIEIKESKAPFYRMIPHLEYVIISILMKDALSKNENEYVIFFDDLDIGFSIENQDSVDSLISLLRAAKHINNDVFSDNGIDAKVIILIRDDMERALSLKATDIGKLFSSYSCEITWLDNEPEEDSKLKKLIEKRAALAFKNANVSYQAKTAWEHLIDDSFSPKTSFKYILDHTFSRPRDLILFLSPLQRTPYNIPLKKQDVNYLLGMYSAELHKELRNELSSFYSPHAIYNIFTSLKEISKIKNCSYQKALSIIKLNCANLEPKLVLDDLFERSIIGNINPINNWVSFKYRANVNQEAGNSIDEKKNIILHSGVRINLEKV